MGYIFTWDAIVILIHCIDILVQRVWSQHFCSPIAWQFQSRSSRSSSGLSPGFCAPQVALAGAEDLQNLVHMGSVHAATGTRRPSRGVERLLDG